MDKQKRKKKQAPKLICTGISYVKLPDEDERFRKAAKLILYGREAIQ